jgi:acetylornithine/N-succinyldiaminopimelate aminotransferase
MALELNREIGAAVVRTALERGLLINSPRPAVLRFMPALNIAREEIDRMIDLLRAILDECNR